MIEAPNPFHDNHVNPLSVTRELLERVIEQKTRVDSHKQNIVHPKTVVDFYA